MGEIFDPSNSGRCSYIGGSDARTVMGHDEAALIRLWREKRGEIDAVPDAAAADVLLVFAQDGDGSGLFAVATSSPGLSATQERGIDQTRKQFRVTLDDVSAERIGAAGMPRER